MKDIRVIIAGSRDFNDYDLLEETCNRLLGQYRQEEIIIVSGTAHGADRLGERYARKHGYRLSRFPADWEAYGRSAGPIRNRKMAEYASEGTVGMLVAFWDEKSRGTKNMLQTASKLKLEVHCILF